MISQFSPVIRVEAFFENYTQDKPSELNGFSPFHPS